MSILTAPGSLTVADAIEETRGHLAGDGRVKLNRLSGAITSGATTLTCEFDIDFGAGTYLTINDEIFYVWSVDTSTKIATVQRGVLGTDAAAHADDDLIEVNPRFPRPIIKRALRDEIASWGEELFQVATIELSVNDLSTSRTGAISQGVNANIGTTWYFGLDLRHSPEPGGTTWPRVRNWELVRNADTDDFANGNALFIYEQVPTGTVQLVYATPMDVSTFADATVLTSGIGLATTMVDIPALGAAWRLLSPREVARTDMRAKGISRHSSEVPAGHMSGVADSIRRLRNARISEEATRLRAKYPWRSG